MTPGLFVSFEGGEASGKTVQATRLARDLRGAGHDVVLTREPGGTALGERIRDVLLHASDVPLTPRAAALLFSAARAQHVDEVIGPALEAGRIVIADRFFDSTAVYQGAGHGLDARALAGVTAFAVGEVRPLRTFVIDVPVEVAARRRALETARAWDRFETGAAEFHARLRAAYQRLAAAEPERVLLIPGDRGEDEVARDIRERLEPLLPVRTGTARTIPPG